MKSTDELNKLLEKAKFKFAKSMPKIPHSYTLRETWDSKEFDRAVEMIRKYGIPERFFSKTFIYYYANGYKYWTMGFPVHRTKLINRAKVESTDS